MERNHNRERIDHRRRSRSRSRSRSPSPYDDDQQRRPPHSSRGHPSNDRRGVHDNRELEKERLERERRERMARLRAENEAEERNTVPSSMDGEASGHYTNGDGTRAFLEKKKRKSKKMGNDDGGDDDSEEDDDERNEMLQLMGFGGFGTTKGKAVADNQSSAARGAAAKNKGRKYRQYMNRKGGFNRPLDKMP